MRLEACVGQLFGAYVAAGLAFAIAVAACGGSPAAPAATTPQGSATSSDATSSGPLVFRRSPVALDTIRWITPLGNLNPPGHAIPTDHIYFYIADPDAGESPALRRTDFSAPADGTVTDVFASESTDRKLFIRATSSVSYYVDHIIADAAIGRGTVLTAGQRIGTTGSAYAVDLGVVNSAYTVPGLLNSARYIGDTLHADAPLKYFEEPLRGELYAKVQRLGSELDGRIGYDVAGRLAGNWYAELGGIALSFARDTYDPSQVRISDGGRLLGPHVYAIGPGEPLPDDVSMASGLVRYSLYGSRTGFPISQPQVATLLVQMVGEQRIQAEIFLAGSAATAFTTASVFYVR